MLSVSKFKIFHRLAGACNGHAEHTKEMETLRAQVEELKIMLMFTVIENVAAHEQINNLISGQHTELLDLPTAQEFDSMLSSLKARMSTADKKGRKR